MASVALLRGINVGGKNVLRMADLREVFIAEGCTDAQTFIQSGNVVFRASKAVTTRLGARVTNAIEKRFGLRVPVVLRTYEELERVIAKNPFLKKATDLKALHVAFAADAPTPAQIATLDPNRSPPDTFEVRGREIYFMCPTGVGKSKLTMPYFDTKLGTVWTMRNWNTVQKLAELAKD